MTDSPLELSPITHKPFNAETPHGALLQDVTPARLFYVRNHFEVPSIAASQFMLEINGAVAQPIRLSLNRLQELPSKDLLVVLECAGNGRSSMNPPIKGTPWKLGAVSQARFTGTPLNQLLMLAGHLENVVEVRFTGADRGKVSSGERMAYARSLPLEAALHPDTLLAWNMNGEPLPPEHGFPLRLVVPSWYGMASVKWLREITVLTTPFEGFFQTQEYVYVDEAGVVGETPVRQMRVRSLILKPEQGSTMEQQAIEVSGIAWSGKGSVTRVELSFDGGNHWIEAQIKPPSSLYGMTRWSRLWKPVATGRYTITARAIDSQGNIQPLSPRWNRGGYGNNNVHQLNVSIVAG